MDICDYKKKTHFDQKGTLTVGQSMVHSGDSMGTLLILSPGQN